MNALQAYWQKLHPGSVPVGGMLKDGGPFNLTRFHLLPHGREAAFNRYEYRLLLERYNVIMTEVLGENEPVWLIVPVRNIAGRVHRVEDPVEAARIRRLKRRYDLRTQWDFYSADQAVVYKIEAVQTIWQHDGFNRLLLQVYNDLISDVVFMNIRTGAVAAPYVAGVVVSQPSPKALMDLIAKYYGWLPPDGAGLLRFDPAQMKGGNFPLPKAAAAALQNSLGR